VVGNKKKSSPVGPRHVIPDPALQKLYLYFQQSLTAIYDRVLQIEHPVPDYNNTGKKHFG
jgi:hypothetical protein